MESERWHKVTGIFSAVRSLQGTARDRELSARCAEDERLRADVETLLDADPDAECFVIQLAARAGIATPEAEEVLHAPGRRIGAYRLLRLLGRGGMGVVYLAERADELYSKQVAIKLLPIGLETAEARERFERERAILAQLDHPGIARLLDGGVTPEGTPYYVMEYVPGEPLDRYCERHGLDIEARLQLFRQVCEAVHYAHRNLVIHRDIKPSNILVTQDSGARLLDFGVAKLLEPRDADVATATLPDRRYVSPTYAAPELLGGGRVTTACDVYGLGMVLYELLAGATPFGDEKRTPMEWVETVRDLRAQPPSQACVLGAAWCARLRGDLDTITLKALSSEPDRRYESVQALLDDIERHRTGRTVEARPDSLGYRFGKFWQRHRVAVTLVVMLAVSILAGLVVSVWQAHQAALARDRARLEAVRAQEEADRASRVARFLGELFMAANPESEGGASLSALELLDSGVEMIEEKFPDDPLIRAELQHKVGAIYVDYRMPEKAEALLTKALETRRASLGPGHADTVDVLNTLGVLAYQTGDYELAGEYLEEARRFLETNDGDALRLASTLNVLGLLHKRQGRYDEAIADYELAAKIYQVESDGDDAALGRVFNNLGTVYHDMSRHEEAIPNFERALAIYETSVGPDHYLTAGALGNLAMARRLSGDLEGVEEQLRRVVRIMESDWGHDHPSVAINQSELARALTDLGKVEEAEALLKDSLNILRNTWGPDHPYTAYDLKSIGFVHLERDDPQGAIPYFEEALAVREKHFGPGHPDVANSLQALANALEDAGRLDEALNNHEKALGIWRQAVGEDSPELWNSVRAVAELMAATSDCKGARALIKELPEAAGVDLKNKTAQTIALISRSCD